MLLASVTHIAIIFGGADWYRFFGAGEEMALMQESGSYYPAVLTGFIALVLAIWSLYAFSGAGLMRRLPFIKPALATIAVILLARGFLGIPVVLFSDNPYFAELGSNLAFIIVSSIICLAIGLCYGFGAYQLYRSKSQGA
ncbi:hypothetical protein [Microbulbifer taiwanensis]